MTGGSTSGLQCWYVRFDQRTHVACKGRPLRTHGIRENIWVLSFSSGPSGPSSRAAGGGTRTADDSGRLSIIRRAATRLGAGDIALDTAERSGLVRVRGDDLRLRHPLVRSAVYAAATTSQRQHAHRALAALDAAGDLDRATWHAALASAGVDDDAVAYDLDAVAERATRRGGHEAASAASERAAELSSSAGARAGRLFAAAKGAWLAGNGARARALSGAARDGSGDPVLGADIDSLRAGSSGTSARRRWGGGSSCTPPVRSPAPTPLGPWR